MAELISLPGTMITPEQQQVLEERNNTLVGTMACQDGLKLNDAQIEVIDYLRHCYARFGTIRHTHSLMLALETRFALQGGKTYLQRLFPNGSVIEACVLAGIPSPLDMEPGIK